MTSFFNNAEIVWGDHPKFSNVRLALLVSGKQAPEMSVCMLDIAAGTDIPIHTHDPQTDSIFILQGQGEAYVNGGWKPIAAGDYIFVPALEEHGIRNTSDDSLVLFVHHSPPLL